MSETPDFASLYASDDGDGLTPRMAMLLWLHAIRLADEWREAIDVPDTRSGLIGAALPAIARRAALDNVWHRQFCDAFDVLADRLALGGGDEGLARTHGEEMALHLVIAAADRLGDFGFEEQLDHLPATAPDSEFDPIDDLFRDNDILLLFNQQFDGVEDPDGEVNVQFGIGDLRPQRWFEPFHDGSG